MPLTATSHDYDKGLSLEVYMTLQDSDSDLQLHTYARLEVAPLDWCNTHPSVLILDERFHFEHPCSSPHQSHRSNSLFQIDLTDKHKPIRTQALVQKRNT